MRGMRELSMNDSPPVVDAPVVNARSSSSMISLAWDRYHSQCEWRLGGKFSKEQILMDARKAPVGARNGGWATLTIQNSREMAIGKSASGDVAVCAYQPSDITKCQNMRAGEHMRAPGGRMDVM